MAKTTPAMKAMKTIVAKIVRMQISGEVDVIELDEALADSDPRIAFICGVCLTGRHIEEKSTKDAKQFFQAVDLLSKKLDQEFT